MCVSTNTNQQSGILSQNQHATSSTEQRGEKLEDLNRLTASELIFPSGAPSLIGQSLVLGISITPSMMACATCTPLGPNSRARLCPVARRANLPLANEALVARAEIDAVVPVMIRDGGCGDDSTESRRSGSTACAKRKNPRLRAT